MRALPLLMSCPASACKHTSGNEVGPFMAVEQSILSDEIPGSQRTNMFAWYNLLGYLSTAIGSVVAGSVCALLVDQVSGGQLRRRFTQPSVIIGTEALWVAGGRCCLFRSW
jgi:hypothetical protein